MQHLLEGNDEDSSGLSASDSAESSCEDEDVAGRELEGLTGHRSRLSSAIAVTASELAPGHVGSVEFSSRKVAGNYSFCASCKHRWSQCCVLFGENPHTLDITIRAVIGVTIATLAVVVPQVYDSFSSEVQGNLSSGAVMITFCVADTVGDSVSWSVSGIVGTLVAMAYYWVLFAATAHLDEMTYNAVSHVFYCLFTLFVNVSGASYMARQMALGYSAYFTIMHLSHAHDPMARSTAIAVTASVWVTVAGAVLSVLVMLPPPWRWAKYRLYTSTLPQVSTVMSQIGARKMSTYLVMQSSPACDSSERQARLQAHTADLTEKLKHFSSLISSLEADLGAFWWEGTTDDQQLIERFIQTLKSIEAAFTMEREALTFFAAASHANKQWHPAESHAELKELGLMNARVVKLMTISRNALHHHARNSGLGGLCVDLLCCGRLARWKRNRRNLLDDVRSMRETASQLQDFVRRLKARLVVRLQRGQLRAGTGASLFLQNAIWRCGVISEFSLWLATAISEHHCLHDEDDPTFCQHLSASAQSSAKTCGKLLGDIAIGIARKLWRTLPFDPRGRSWAFALKLTIALELSLLLSAYGFNFDSTAACATAYILGAPKDDARCLGGTIWKGFSRVVGVMLGGILPAVIHDFFVPASQSAADCTTAGQVVMAIGTCIWCFIGLFIYKVNGMNSTVFGNFGYLGLVMAFSSAEMFLAGCQNTVNASSFLFQTVVGACILLVIEIVLCPMPANVAIVHSFDELIQHTASILKHEEEADFAATTSGDSYVAGALDRDGWVSERAWLFSKVSQVDSQLNQASIEDAFPFAHACPLFMPAGYSTTPTQAQTCKTVLSHLQTMNLTVTFLLAAEDAHLHLQKQLLDASSPSLRQASRHQVHPHLPKAVKRVLRKLRNALWEIGALVEHTLENDWEARDVILEETAASILQGGCDLDIIAAKTIFEEVVENADPAVSDRMLAQHYEAFEARLHQLQMEANGHLDPSAIRTALRQAIETLSGTPSLSFGSLDSLVKEVDEVLKGVHGDNELENALKRSGLQISGNGEMDSEAFKVASDVFLQLAIIDALALLSHSGISLCQDLGYFWKDCASTSPNADRRSSLSFPGLLSGGLNV